MSFLRPIQWYHSHVDTIWPDGTFNQRKYKWLSRTVCLFLTNGGLDVGLLEGLDIDVALHMLRRYHRPENKSQLLSSSISEFNG